MSKPLPDSYFGDIEQFARAQRTLSACMPKRKNTTWHEYFKRMPSNHTDTPSFAELAKLYAESTLMLQRKAILFEIAKRGTNGLNENRRQASIFLREVAYSDGYDYLSKLACNLLLRNLLPSLMHPFSFMRAYYLPMLEFLASTTTQTLFYESELFEAPFSTQQKYNNIYAFLQKIQEKHKESTDWEYELWCKAVRRTECYPLFVKDRKYRMPWNTVYFLLFENVYGDIELTFDLRSPLWKQKPNLQATRKILQQDDHMRAMLTLDCARIFKECGRASPDSSRHKALLSLTAWLFHTCQLVHEDARV